MLKIVLLHFFGLITMGYICYRLNLNAGLVFVLGYYAGGRWNRFIHGLIAKHFEDHGEETK